MNLSEQIEQVCKVRHFSKKTIKAYQSWCKQFVTFIRKRDAHPTLFHILLLMDALCRKTCVQAVGARVCSGKTCVWNSYPRVFSPETRV